MILRPATIYDTDYFYKLRCDPVASRMSRRRAPTWEEHMNWWTRTTDLRFVAEEEGAYVGTLRLSMDGVVSIIVDPLVRGAGWGPVMLRELEPYAKAHGIETMLAEIAVENTPSQKCFLKAGWFPILFEKHV